MKTSPPDDSGKLTVYFEEPFWVGVFERIRGGKLSAAKITFGAEPTDEELFHFVIEHFRELRYGPSVDADPEGPKIGFKRAQREARESVAFEGVGTRSQLALKALQEQNKLERKQSARERKKEEDRKRFESRQIKKQEKHRGH